MVAFFGWSGSKAPKEGDFCNLANPPGWTPRLRHRRSLRRSSCCRIAKGESPDALGRRLLPLAPGGDELGPVPGGFHEDIGVVGHDPSEDAGLPGGVVGLPFLPGVEGAGLGVLGDFPEAALGAGGPLWIVGLGEGPLAPLGLDEVIQWGADGDSEGDGCPVGKFPGADGDTSLGGDPHGFESLVRSPWVLGPEMEE